MQPKPPARRSRAARSGPAPLRSQTAAHRDRARDARLPGASRASHWPASRLPGRAGIPRARAGWRSRAAADRETDNARGARVPSRNRRRRSTRPRGATPRRRATERGCPAWLVAENRSPASGTRGGIVGPDSASSPRRSAATASSEDDANEYSPPNVPRPGVGSNGIQPSPANQTSTQACASWSVTTHVPPSLIPLVKPTATRAGIPSIRSMAAMAPAKCWQYPAFVRVTKATRGGLCFFGGVSS